MTIASETKLIRAIGLKEIIAMTINGIIGAGIFAVPATIAAILGMASPLAFALAGLCSAIIVICFAELGGKFDRTGGAYLYAYEAFGEQIGFVLGWLYFLARLTSIAALSNAMAGFLSYFVPVDETLRAIVVAFVLVTLGGINYSGIRFSSNIINFLTIAKLLPLFLFIIVGFGLIQWKVLLTTPLPEAGKLSQALLLAIFAFSGFEVIAIPGAEIIQPKRNLPLGILIGTGVTILVYVSIQTVAVSAYEKLAGSQSPLAEAADVILGSKGGSILSAGAFCSTLGTLTSLLLVGPRILYAMALNRQMPAAFNRIHDRFRTPHVTILITTVLAIALALTGTFTALATMSAIVRLLTYIGAAAALIVLRKKQPSPETFRAPVGILFPLLAIVLSVFMLSGATMRQWIAGALAVGVGAILYFFSRTKIATAP
ncbi:MAG TPA: APC family permease [Acidobacteriota bacterium]